MAVPTEDRLNYFLRNPDLPRLTLRECYAKERNKHNSIITVEIDTVSINEEAKHMENKYAVALSWEVMKADQPGVQIELNIFAAHSPEEALGKALMYSNIDGQLACHSVKQAFENA